MITDEKNIKKICSFYVSDYHLEMTILPYVNEKTKKGEKVFIFSENNLEKSMNILLEKVNIDNKEKIRKIDWKEKRIDNNENISQIIKEKNNKKINFIVNGSKKYIDQINNIIESKKIKNYEIVNCFYFDEIRENARDIANEYDVVLNNI